MEISYVRSLSIRILKNISNKWKCWVIYSHQNNYRLSKDRSKTITQSSSVAATGESGLSTANLAALFYIIIFFSQDDVIKMANARSALLIQSWITMIILNLANLVIINEEWEERKLFENVIISLTTALDQG